MTKPTSHPEARRTQVQQPAAAPPGIINDLPAQPHAATTQSMIINDLNPSGAAPAQQMIINDIPSGPPPGIGQQMIINDVRLPQDNGAAQQMIVNDVAFNNLVKGLEALTRGEVPKGPQPMPMPQPQPAPRPQPQAAPRNAPPQGVVPAPAPQPRPQATGPMPAPARSGAGPQPMPRPAAQVPAPMPRPAPQPEAGAVRQPAQPQPMVINTPQPLVKPRREEPALPPQPAPAPVNRMAAGAAARSILTTPAAEKQPAPRPERRAPARKASAKSEAVRARATPGEEWRASYAGRTMMPSTIFCVGLSVLAVWTMLRFLPRDWYLEFLAGTVGFIWLLQCVRWAYRVAGYRYRLTSEHLHLHRGLLYGKPVQVPRGQIVSVKISANIVEKLLGVGRVVVQHQNPKDGKSATVELEGIRQPAEVVQKLGKGGVQK